jgi:hypothetical protein
MRPVAKELRAARDSRIYAGGLWLSPTQEHINDLRPPGGSVTSNDRR